MSMTSSCSSCNGDAGASTRGGDILASEAKKSYGFNPPTQSGDGNTTWATKSKTLDWVGPGGGSPHHEKFFSPKNFMLM